MDIPVGISIGSFFSCISYYSDNGNFIVFSDEFNNKLHPCIISYTNDGNEIIGKIDNNNENTKITQLLNMIGKSTDEIEILCNNLNIKIKRNANNMIYILTKNNEYLTIEMLFAKLLVKLKEIGESNMNKQIKNIVITIPYHFNDRQRLCIKDSCALAKLTCLRIINENMSTCMFYNYENGVYIVIDIGAILSCVSVLFIEDFIFESLSNSYSENIGGYYFNNCLYTYCIEQCKKKQIHITNKLCKFLQQECERVKIILSKETTTNIYIDKSICEENYSFSITITQCLFNELSMNLYKELVKLIDNTINTAKVDKLSFNNIILTGGSIRIPYIQELIKNYFFGRNIETQKPDTIKAMGAAKQAKILGSYSSNSKSTHLLLDTITFNLGIETTEGLVHIIAPKDTSIPFKKSIFMSCSCGIISEVNINIYEGLRPQIEHCNFITSLSLPINRIILNNDIKFIKITIRYTENNELNIKIKDIISKVKIQSQIIQNIQYTQNDIEMYNTDATLNLDEDTNIINSINTISLPKSYQKCIGYDK